MKIAAIKKPGVFENLKIEDRADPVVGPGEILVRIHASSLNYHDLAVVKGWIKAEDGRIPMSDGAGEVVAVGEGATRFKVGDKVVSLFFPNWQTGPIGSLGFASVPGDGADGFAAELVRRPETAFTLMPAGYSYRKAATLPCAALTAWRGLIVEGSVKPGDWVLTQGTAAGARVISTSSSDEKLKRMKALGADHLINYKTTTDWGRAAMELTGGQGVDEIIEVGGPNTLAQSIAACRVGGHISLIGILTGFSGEFPVTSFFSKNLTMSGITVGSAKHQEDMIAAIEASAIEPVLEKDFPLDQIADAFAHQESQTHFGKITLSI